MKLRHLATAARWLTAAALLWATVLFVRHARTHLEMLVAWAELAGCILFLLPRLWPAGGAILLVVFAVAFGHHAMQGQPSLWLIYPSLVVILLIAIRRDEQARSAP